MLRNLKKIGCFINFGDDILISTLITLQSQTWEHHTLIYYMQNGLSIYQSKYCKTMFLALPCLFYKIFNRSGVGKATV